jgi:hypothetical protein
LQGDLDEMIDALRAEERAGHLRASDGDGETDAR